MALRTVWNNVEPNLFLALYSTLAPFKEGRVLLADFAAKADPVFVQINYLAFVVMNPVQKICMHLLDISFLHGILKLEQRKTQLLRFNKYKMILKYYITKQYMLALLHFSNEEKIENPDNKQLNGTDINALRGVTRVLLNLPREYQRWNEFYRQPDKQIKPKEEKSFELLKTKELLPRPFDVGLPIHVTFQTVCDSMVATSDPEAILDVCLDDSWDPLYIAKNMVAKRFDVDVDDMYNKSPEYFEMGISKRTKKRKVEEIYDELDQKPEALPAAVPDTPVPETAARPPEQVVPEQKPATTQAGRNELTWETIRGIVIKNAKKLKADERMRPGHVFVWNGILQDMIQQVTGVQKPLYNNQRIGKAELQDEPKKG